jgi:hypothetical protein
MDDQIRKNEPPRSKLRGISRLVAALQTKQASGNMTRRDSSYEKNLENRIYRYSSHGGVPVAAALRDSA